MSINFIKSIAKKQPDERAHRKFIRYSAGDFEKEEFTVKKGSSFVQVKAGFEYLDVILDIMANLIDAPATVKGTITTKEKIAPELKEMGIEPKKIFGKKYTFEAQLQPEKFRELISKYNETAIMLLNIKSGKRSLSVKKSAPKPGKLVEGFLSAKFIPEDFQAIKEEFLFDFDVENFKSAVIKHTYIIEGIVIPEEHKNNPEMARITSKRKGKIIRVIDIDGKQIKKEIDFTA